MKSFSDIRADIQGNADAENALAEAEAQRYRTTCASVLPADSAARKEIPVCTGCLDYAPDAIVGLIDLLTDGEEISSPDSNDVLALLPCRGGPRVTAQLAQVCLDLLQDELVGPPTQCRSRLLAERWGAALAEVSRISKAGNDKHNPGEPLHHARGKSMDHADCIARHTLEQGGFDGPFRHSACRAWRALMLFQEECEAEGCPLARAAWLPDGTKGSDRFNPHGPDFGECEHPELAGIEVTEDFGEEPLRWDPNLPAHAEAIGRGVPR